MGSLLHGRRLFRTPSTRLGWLSAMFLGLDAVLIMATITLFDAPNEIGPAWLGTFLRIGLGLSMLAGMVTGVAALAAKRERSWLVWLSGLLPAFVIGNEAVQRVIA